MVELKLIAILIFCIVVSIIFFVMSVKDCNMDSENVYVIFYAADDVEWIMREIVFKANNCCKNVNVLLIDDKNDYEITKIFIKMADGHVNYTVLDV